MDHKSDDAAWSEAAQRPYDQLRPVGQDDSGRHGKRSAWVWALVAVAVIAVLVVVFVARVFEIPSGSMETTLHGCGGCDNDHVLVDKLTYRFGEPERGDIVVFAVPRTWHNSELPVAPTPTNPVLRALGLVGAALGMPANRTDLIKRVIAVGGQTVSCCDARNRVIVDGRPVDEPYVYFDPAFGPPRQVAFGPVRVPPGQLWVMGDSRNNSVDSRAQGNGPVPLADVVGRARWIVWPMSRFGAVGPGGGS